MRTVTGSRDANGVVVPHVTKFRTGATGSDCGDPLHTITAGNSAADHPAGAAHAMGLVEAFLSKYHGERPGDKDGRASGPSEPIKTLDTQNRFGLVSATLMTNTTGHACSDLADPASTITSGGQQALVGATLIGAGGPSYSGKPTNAADPLGTVMTENHRAIAAAHMVRICQNGSNGGGARSAEAPVNTIVSKNEQCLVSASLVGVGGRAGQSPERSVEQPVATVTAKADAAIAAATLVKHYGTCRDGQPCTEPMPTITCGGNHVSEVRAFLVKYYSSGSRDQSLKAPMHTLTAKARMGLVTVQGQEYQIADIGLRMLQPHELLRAQFGRFASEYKLVGSKADQVMAIGNSVPPELAEAIVRANFPTECERSN